MEIVYIIEGTKLIKDVGTP